MTQKERQKLIRVLALLSSDKDGEVIGAAKAAIRLLEKNNATFDDVISGTISAGGEEKPYGAYRWAKEEQERRDNDRFKRVDWRRIVTEIFNAYFPILSEWEQDFIDSLCDRRMSTVTDNQWKVIRRIAMKMESKHGY